MESRGWWSKEEDDVTKERLKQEVMTTFKRVEKLKRHELKQLFEDVYGGDEPWNLVSIFYPPFRFVY
jgi:2-oxoisovalerate dehydrogenase E1 component alpha subunit